jgi:hypothetical protein
MTRLPARAVWYRTQHPRARFGYHTAAQALVTILASRPGPGTTVVRQGNNTKTG